MAQDIVARGMAGRLIANTRRSPNVIVCLGDSRMAQQFVDPPANLVKSQYGFLNVANALRGQRLSLAANYGVSGYRSDQYLADAYLGPALATNALWFLIFGIVNDVAADAAVDHFNTRVMPACQRILNAGGRPILCTEPGATSLAGSATSIAAIHAYNQKVRQAVAVKPGLVLFDLAAATLDPTSTTIAFKSGYSTDGTHYLVPGGYAQGQAFAALMDALRIPSCDLLPCSAGETWANSGVQNLANPLFVTTTGGTAGTGTTAYSGVPTGITNSVGSTGVTATLTTSAGAYGNDVQLAITATQAGTYKLVMDMAANESPGETWEALAQCDIASGSSHLAAASIELETNRASVSTTARDLYSDTAHGALPAIAMTHSLRTPLLTIPSGARGWFTFRMVCQFDAAGSATVTWRRAAVRKRQSVS